MAEYIAYSFVAVFLLWFIYALWTSAKKSFGNLQTDIDGSYNKYTHSHNTNSFNTYNVNISLSHREMESLMESPLLSNKVKEIANG